MSNRTSKILAASVVALLLSVVLAIAGIPADAVGVIGGLAWLFTLGIQNETPW